MLASTSPPIRQFGPIVEPPRTLARKSWVSRPIEHGPSTRVNGWTQAPAAIEIGPLVDPDGLVDREPVRRADDRRAGEVAVAQRRLAVGLEVADEVIGVPGDEIPGPGDPLAADLAALGPRGEVLEPAVDAPRLEAGRVLGADRGEGGQALGEPNPGHPIAEPGRVEIGWRDPTAIGDDHRAPREPVAVIHGRVRVALAADGRQERPDHRTPTRGAGSDPERPGDLGPERPRSQDQVEGRPRERQRFEPGDGIVLDQAESHR